MRWRRSSRLVTLGSLDGETVRAAGWLFTAGIAGAKRLIVSHIGQYNLDEAVAELRAFYTGPLTVGADLQCTQAQ